SITAPSGRSTPQCVRYVHAAACPQLNLVYLPSQLVNSKISASPLKFAATGSSGWIKLATLLHHPELLKRRTAAEEEMRVFRVQKRAYLLDVGDRLLDVVGTGAVVVDVHRERDDIAFLLDDDAVSAETPHATKRREVLGRRI